MFRISLAMALFAGVAMMTGMSVDAQVKDKVDMKVDSKGVKKDTQAGEIEIVHNKKGYRYRVVNAEGKTIAMPPASKHWETKEDVHKAIAALKATLEKGKTVDVKDKD